MYKEKKSKKKEEEKHKQRSCLLLDIKLMTNLKMFLYVLNYYIGIG